MVTSLPFVLLALAVLFLTLGYGFVALVLAIIAVVMLAT